MNGRIHRTTKGCVALLALLILALCASPAFAAIEGLTGTNFSFVADTGRISTPDGGNYLIWGFSGNGGPVQFPGPTLIVNQGATITVTLSNNLAMPVSLLFPGMDSVGASGGTAGIFTHEATAGSPVTYTFRASNAGTYMYESGTRPEIQVEMGLVGTIVVRPATAGQAYEHADTAFDEEFLFFLSELDPSVHENIELGFMANINNTEHDPKIWMINGRSAPDTMFMNNVPWLPNQPYNCMPTMKVGQKMLIRAVNAGRYMHPLHTHGNHSLPIARYGQLLESAPGAGVDISSPEFTLQMVPGLTVDAIFTWDGSGMGWDIYGHLSDIDREPLDNFPGAEDIDHNLNGEIDTVPPAPGEDPNDHGLPFPVVLPDGLDLAFGGFYSGSPYLGLSGNLPPGEGGLNPNGGFAFMWHSHTEKEMVNFDVFPGGMMTMFIVEAPDMAPPPSPAATTTQEEGR